MARRGQEPRIPYDEKAEVALLGNLILRPSNMDEISRIITPADFYKPSHAHIYSAISELWHRGAEKIDAVIVADTLKTHGLLEAIGGPATLVHLQAEAPSTALTSAQRYSEIILRMSTYRSALRVAEELRIAAYDMRDDPNDIIDSAKAELEAIGIHLGEMPPDTYILDEYLSRPQHERPGWVIPGLLRSGWRVMVVAAEGVGKTVLFRQMAILAAQGLHPLHFGTIDPVRTLIVDLENPEDSVMDVCIPINEKVKARVRESYTPDRAWLWHRPAGINLRSRPDRIALETVISRTQPQLVCLGPLYKAYEVNAHENDELAAREIMAVFDDLRTRYGFGLMLEHHAPKETAGTKRKLMPYGSSLWLRWPEIGINMYPGESGINTLTLGRWRGDRLENEWPISISRSEGFPWTGTWETGYFSNNSESSGVLRRDAITEPVDESLTPLAPEDRDEPQPQEPDDPWDDVDPYDQF